MCNVSYGIAKRVGDKKFAEGEAKGRAEGEAKGRAEGEAKGRAEGEAKGRAEGRAEGKAKGIIETLANSIKSLMGTGQFSFDSAFKVIDAPADKYNLVKELVLG